MPVLHTPGGNKPLRQPTQPQFLTTPSHHNTGTTTPQVNAAVKITGPTIPPDLILLERRRDTKYTSLSISSHYKLVAVVIVTTIVVIMIEFCGGSWLRPSRSE